MSVTARRGLVATVVAIVGIVTALGVGFAAGADQAPAPIPRGAKTVEVVKEWPRGNRLSRTISDPVAVESVVTALEGLAPPPRPLRTSAKCGRLTTELTTFEVRLLTSSGAELAKPPDRGSLRPFHAPLGARRGTAELERERMPEVDDPSAPASRVKPWPRPAGGHPQMPGGPGSAHETRAPDAPAASPLAVLVCSIKVRHAARSRVGRGRAQTLRRKKTPRAWLPCSDHEAGAKRRSSHVSHDKPHSRVEARCLQSRRGHQKLHPSGGHGERGTGAGSHAHGDSALEAGSAGSLGNETRGTRSGPAGWSLLACLLKLAAGSAVWCSTRWPPSPR